jgi:CRISPR-associated protein Cas2
MMDLYDIWSLIVKAIMRTTERKPHKDEPCTEEENEQDNVRILIKDDSCRENNKAEPEQPDIEIPESLKPHQARIEKLLQDSQAGTSIKTDRYGLSEDITGSYPESKNDEDYKVLESVISAVKNERKKKREKIPPGSAADKVLKKTQRDEEKLRPFKERAQEIRQSIENFKEKPKTHMIYFVMYDIEDNKVRKKIADYLMEKGLYRVQKSIFLGETHRREFKNISEVLAEIQASYENSDSIFLVPLAEDYLKSMHIIGKEVDFTLTLHRTNTVFI